MLSPDKRVASSLPVTNSFLSYSAYPSLAAAWSGPIRGRRVPLPPSLSPHPLSPGYPLTKSPSIPPFSVTNRKYTPFMQPPIPRFGGGALSKPVLYFFRQDIQLKHRRDNFHSRSTHLNTSNMKEEHIMNLPEPNSVKSVAIISTGVIGASWAAHFLAHGLEVRASDPGPDAEEKARDYIERAWPLSSGLV